MIRFYDEDGSLVTEPGKVGELYSRSPMLFEGYWKDPEKTAAAMKGEYFSAGDMGTRDEDGFVYLVDRKANMIISGGENIFPSEVENVRRRPPQGQGRGGHRGAPREMGRAGDGGRRPPRGADGDTGGDHLASARVRSPGTRCQRTSSSLGMKKCRGREPGRSFTGY